MKLFKIIGLILVLSPLGQAFGVDQETLRRLHENDPSLTELYLSGNQIGPEGARALAEALRTNTSLTTLSLGTNQIGTGGARALAEALRTNTSLRTLYLYENQIGPAGAHALAEALRTNTSLTELVLSYNQIGDAGAVALADALRTNTSLTKLHFWGNQIGDAGAVALADALRTNTSLTILHLSFNPAIGDAGAVALAEPPALDKLKQLVSTELSRADLWEWKDFESEALPLIAPLLYPVAKLTTNSAWPDKKNSWYGEIFRCKNSKELLNSLHLLYENRSGKAFKFSLSKIQKRRAKQADDDWKMNKKHPPQNAAEIYRDRIDPSRSADLDEQPIRIVHAGTILFLSEFLLGEVPGYRFDPPQDDGFPQRNGIQAHPRWDLAESEAGFQDFAFSYRSVFYADRACNQGRFDLRTIFTAEIAPKYLDPEENCSYEVGLASENLDKLTNLHLRVFKNQLSSPLQDPSTLQPLEIKAPNLAKMQKKLTGLRANWSAKWGFLPGLTHVNP